MKPFDCALLVVLALPASLSGCASSASTEAKHARRITELETECATLRQQLETLRARMRVIDAIDPVFVDPGYAVYPAIDASVLVVDHSHGTVTLDKGKRDGVEVGYVFSAYLGSQYKGQVRVLDVQDSTSTATIVVEKAPITSGDSATTSL